MPTGTIGTRRARRRLMALREFTDRTGCRWRVWDIRPEQLHAATWAEDHVQDISYGWLAFEPIAGGEKRRLSPIPARWETATELELERMLERAEPVQEGGASFHRAPGPVGDEPRPSSTPSAIRTFRYPNGRYWTVNEQAAETTTAGRSSPLLVFTSGARALETPDWPLNWTDMSEDELADLLHRSFPRDPSTGNLTSFRRRRGDAV